MSVSSDSDMDYPTQRLEVLTEVVTHIVGPRHITHHEYFFQVHSGTKLPTRITMKTSQNRFQSNETTESTFNAPTWRKVEKRFHLFYSGLGRRIDRSGSSLLRPKLQRLPKQLL